ncbi:hypothetical protein EHS25_005898 [Saitozyma podzolica]|uniref:ATP-grasp domain-containing protein n=1 Tax=Saitozyma podzolica TaxID=1890683 RepID=A0A427XVI3_9TREE|nr:hypothetical protein EHS25_005898 [Saitozyma podzolica]
MSKGLTLARAFKRAGWTVIGVEEEGWGELCPMRFSASVDAFHLLPPPATAYTEYCNRLLSIAQRHAVTLFIPVSGAGSSVEDARAADYMFEATGGTCRTFIQDSETMLDLHDKDRFMGLVGRLGMAVPTGRMVKSVDQAMEYLRSQGSREPKFVLKCMGLDENRGDMTLFPLEGDDEKLGRTRAKLEGLATRITDECPYVFQEFIAGQEYCTHASVVDGQVTSFVACPSNDMLMTYDNVTTEIIGQRAEAWTRQLLARLAGDSTPSGKTRRLMGHFSYDLILSSKDGELYPLECNARVHTAVILLPLDDIARCYSDNTDSVPRHTLRPPRDTLPRSWIYNDLIMRYLPLVIPSHQLLATLHPSLVEYRTRHDLRPNEDPMKLRVDPTLVADDWLPFLVLWHLWWPAVLVSRWWQGKKWTRLNVSTGRIFEA